MIRAANDFGAVRIWVNREKPYDPKGHSVWDKKKERRREVEEEKEPKPESNTTRAPLCHWGEGEGASAGRSKPVP